jgi:deoxycytidine triphosphate deaminase
MITGGYAIEAAFATGLWKAYRGDERLSVEEFYIGPNSLDVTLSPLIKTPKPCVIVDPVAGIGPEYTERVMTRRGIVLAPGACVLGSINEKFDCASPLDFSDYGFKKPIHFKPDIDGRSSLGRLFIMVHVTAGFGDFDFHKPFTLEIVNLSNSPMRLRPYMRFAQISFQAVLHPKHYRGAYKDQEDTQEPILGEGRF